MSVEARAALLLALAGACSAAPAAGGVAVEGSIGVELRLFDNPPTLPGQRRHAGALVLNPSFSATPGASGAWDVKLSPYLRLDAADSASRYLDLREASVRHRSPKDLWRFGMETVHWGVVESNHLIDIVNQLDPRADVDLEAKLGQPLVSYTRFLDRFGRVELMWLPYHRPRPLLGNESRQRLGPVAQDPAPHGLAPWRRTNDAAIRWSGTLWDVDVGVYGFSGLSREPDQLPSGAERYRWIKQIGLNAQWPVGSMLWKLEAIHRRGHGKPFDAYVVGGEYTFTLPSGELGVLLETMEDQRDASAPPTRFADAMFAGVRFRFNESGDSELLGGVLRDRASNAWLHKLEFSRRILPEVRLGLIVRKIESDDESPYAPLRDDSNLQLTLTHNF
jgi:hypothetical protein